MHRSQIELPAAAEGSRIADGGPLPRPDWVAASLQIAYLVRREGLSSVFASQVATRMAAIAAAGLAVDVAVFTPVGQLLRRGLRARWRTTLEAMPTQLQGHVWRLPSFPSRIDWPMAEASLLAWWLHAHYRHSAGPLILHCRNATVTRMALRAARSRSGTRFVFDCRGLVDHESLYERGLTWDTADAEQRRRAAALASEQREAARQADAVVCVSHAMAEFLAAEYGVERSKCVVTPCTVDARRFAAAARRREEIRSRFRLSERFVVCYCGSLARYQLPHESLRLFQEIRSLDPDAHFFAVTTAPQAMREAARAVGVPDEQITVTSAAADEVPACLAAADVGVLLREDSPVNRVASPVKFAEYLAAGLPVLLSDHIGDSSDLVRRERVGLVVPPDAAANERTSLLREFLNDYLAAPEQWRSRCRAVARRCLDSDVHLPKLVELYHRLAQ